MLKLYRKDVLIKRYLSPLDLRQALVIQGNLKKKLKIRPFRKKVKRIAGFDAVFKDKQVVGAVCLMELPGLNIKEERILKRRVEFPYISGFFAYREGPVIIDLFASLGNKPDVLILDAQGTAHPEGLGLASHVGIILNVPTIGCSKTPLYGSFREPAFGRGSYSYIINPKNKEIIGAVLRTRDRTKSLFISPGHLIDVDSCIDIIMRLTTKFRTPDILRRAHMLAREVASSE